VSSPSLPPDLKEWLPTDDVAHFIVATVDRVSLASFSVRRLEQDFREWKAAGLQIEVAPPMVVCVSGCEGISE